MMTFAKTIVCPKAACPMSGVCARHADYLEALASKESFTILNPEKVETDANGCPYQLRKEKQRIAYGFTHLLAEVPKKYLNYLYCKFPYRSQSSYDRRRRGLYGLSPSEQEYILQIFKRYGVDTSIGFDRYQVEEVYVEP
jgi:hypothetical protein